jgi:hypothetical protein
MNNTDLALYIEGLQIDVVAATVAVPAVGRVSVERIRTVVVFPAPLGPRIPCTCPEGKETDKSSTAFTVPYCFNSLSITIMELPHLLLLPHLRYRPESATVCSQQPQGRYGRCSYRMRNPRYHSIPFWPSHPLCRDVLPPAFP